MDEWWYCLKHGKVEHGAGCANSDRLGPFETEAEAANALELAKQRNEEWSKDDARWNGDNEAN